MKNKLIAGLALSMIVVMVVGIMSLNAPTKMSLANTDDSNIRLVTVTGEGKITVSPDLAYIDIGVQTKNADAAIAQQENAKLMTAVVNAIKAAGVKAEDIKTTGYSLYQTYDYFPDKQSDPYYVANNTVNIKIKDITKVGTIIDTATGAGANTINSVRFTVADDSKFYQDALKLAMANAKGKAGSIMGTFNVTPSIPHSVTEVSYGGNLQYDYYPAKGMGEMAADVSTPIESGEITITATVTVSYDY
ncbi:MAG TPA: hypothetical protein DCS67_11885 [Clostridiales bacterium UBA8960]|jgi:uncharacterized protein YggE|nr:hypothetical protein [Clostridiales bacterium UBA8960]